MQIIDLALLLKPEPIHVRETRRLCMPHDYISVVCTGDPLVQGLALALRFEGESVHPGCLKYPQYHQLLQCLFLPRSVILRM